MFCVIGEVDKFIVQHNDKEFIKYSMSEEEIKNKLRDNGLELIDNENNNVVLSNIRDNVYKQSEGSATLIGARALYRDMIGKKVNYGDIELSAIRATLMRRDLKYCFLDLDGEVKVSRDTPNDMIEVREFKGEKIVQQKVHTNLQLDVRDADGKISTVKVPADFIAPIISEELEQTMPFLCKDLDLVLGNQRAREVNTLANKVLTLIIKDIDRNGLIDVEKIEEHDHIKYGTYNIFKLRLLKTIERRLKKDD